MEKEFIKLVVLGDIECSKREILISLTNPDYPESYDLQHEFDPYIYHHKYPRNGILTHLNAHLFDSTGIEDSDEICKILCRNISVAVFVFSVTNPVTFQSLQEKWIPNFRANYPTVPFIIIALHAKFREDKAKQQMLARQGIRMFPRSQGEFTSQRVGALAYFECEISPRTGIEAAFYTAITAGINYKQGATQERPGLYSEFCRNGKDYELQTLYDSGNVDICSVKDSYNSPFLEAMKVNNIGFGRLLVELNGGVGNLANGELDRIPLAVLEWTRKGIVKELNLSNNNLLNIPIELHALKNCILDENPLSSLPKEMRNEKWPKVKKYLEVLQARSIAWNVRKVVLLGDSGTGKSSVVRLLGAKPIDTKDDKNRLEMSELKLKSASKENISFKIWDFANALITHPTHRFFITSGAIYIVTFSYSKYKQANLEYWFKIIKERTKGHCAIVLVGTHSDLLSDDEVSSINKSIRQKFPKIRFPAFEGQVIAVGTKVGTNQKKLRECLVQVALQPSMQFSAAERSWILFDELIRTNSKSGTNHISYATYVEWAATLNISQTDLDLVTSFLVKIGTLIRYPKLTDPETDQEHDFVLLKPQWLIRCMDDLFAADNVSFLCGYVHVSSKGFENAFEDSFSRSIALALLTKFKIIEYLKPDRFLIPCLLPPQANQTALKNLFPAKIPKDNAAYGRILQFGQLPLDFFGRAMASILRLEGASDMLSWCNGLVCSFVRNKKKGGSSFRDIYALFTFSDMYEFSVYLRFPKDNQPCHPAMKIWKEIMDSIYTMIESFYPRLQEMTKEYIPCTHCMTPDRPIAEAFRFTLEECQAVILTGNTNYLYCSHIPSPPRRVALFHVAPDIGLKNIPSIPNESLTIGKTIGKGAFGVVYKGTIGEEQVAVKELIFSATDQYVNKQIFLDFQIEAFMMTKLNHINIVRLFGIRIKPLGLVLELITGKDLFQFMHTENEEEKELISIGQNDFDWALRFDIACDIANGLHFLQTRSPPIIHRDLRSPNIFMREDHSAVIGDFGLTRQVYHSIGGILASWQWVAPECLDSNCSEYDITSDIYSFGIVLWELAAIAMPFGEFASDPVYFNESRQTYKLLELKRAIIEDNLRPTIPTGTPKAFAELIRACWDHSPKKRPSTEQILFDLKSMGTSGLITRKRKTPKAIKQAIFPCLEPTMSRLPSPLAVKYLKSKDEEHYVTATIWKYLFYAEGSLLWLGLSRGSIHVMEKEDHCLKLVKNWTAHSKRICALLTVRETVWSYSEDGTIRVWEPDTFAVKHEIDVSSHTESGTMILTSLKTVWVSSSYDGIINVYDAFNYTLLKTINEECVIGSLQMAQHDNIVWMSSTKMGNKIALFNVATFESLGSFPAHSTNILGIVSLSPLKLVCTYSLSDMRLWGGSSIADLTCIETLTFQTSVTCAMKLPAEGKFPLKLLCGSYDGSVVQYNENGVPQQELNTVVDEIGDKRSLCSVRQFDSHLLTISKDSIKIWPNIQNLNSVPQPPKLVRLLSSFHEV